MNTHTLTRVLLVLAGLVLLAAVVVYGILALFAEALLAVVIGVPTMTVLMVRNQKVSRSEHPSQL